MQPKLKRNLLFRFPLLLTFLLLHKQRSQQNRPALHRICEATEHPVIRIRVIKPSLACLCVFLCSSLLKEKVVAHSFATRAFAFKILYTSLSPFPVSGLGSQPLPKLKLCFSRHRLRCPLIYTLLVHRSDRNSPLQQQRVVEWGSSLVDSERATPTKQLMCSFLYSLHRIRTQNIKQNDENCAEEPWFHFYYWMRRLVGTAVQS